MKPHAGRRQTFFPPRPGARPAVQIPAVAGNIQGRNGLGDAVYCGSLRCRANSRRGTDDDFKPLPSFSGFVYQHARFGPDKKTIEVAIRPREGAAAVCSGCQKPAPGYDQLPERRFEFIPFWGFLVFFLYRMRRVNCRNCGVVVEEVPWGDGKHQLTRAYMLFLRTTCNCRRFLGGMTSSKVRS